MYNVLGGEIILSNSTFLPYCMQSGLKLRVTLDTRNNVMESNELNNIVYIDVASLSDGDASFCSSKPILIINCVQLLFVQKLFERNGNFIIYQNFCDMNSLVHLK